MIEMKTLTLSLKKQWFDMIKSGVKKEEYRDANYYWVARLLQKAKNPISGLYESHDGVIDYLDELMEFTEG